MLGTCDAQQRTGRGVAGLVAGAMSMAAGEYVSVHSQACTEQADLKRSGAWRMQEIASVENRQAYRL